MRYLACDGHELLWHFTFSQSLSGRIASSLASVCSQVCTLTWQFIALTAKEKLKKVGVEKPGWGEKRSSWQTFFLPSAPSLECAFFLQGLIGKKEKREGSGRKKKYFINLDRVQHETRHVQNLNSNFALHPGSTKKWTSTKGLLSRLSESVSYVQTSMQVAPALQYCR